MKITYVSFVHTAAEFNRGSLYEKDVKNLLPETIEFLLKDDPFAWKRTKSGLRVVKKELVSHFTFSDDTEQAYLTVKTANVLELCRALREDFYCTEERSTGEDKRPNMWSSVTDFFDTIDAIRKDGRISGEEWKANL